MRLRLYVCGSYGTNQPVAVTPEGRSARDQNFALIKLRLSRSKNVPNEQMHVNCITSECCHYAALMTDSKLRFASVNRCSTDVLSS